MSATFAFILGLLLIAFIPSANAQCGKKCRWRLCKLNGDALDGEPTASDFRRLNLRGPGTALSPFVCLPGTPDARMINTGEALVSNQAGGKNAVRVSKFRPRGLRKRFPRDYFQLFPICFTEELQGLQGVGRLASRGTQENFLDNLCVVLPITSYKVGDRTVTTRSKKDCLAFGTRTRAIVVELQWGSSDDLDLSVKEPDGTLLDFKNKSSGFGSLNNDIGVAVCGNLPSGKENVFYKPNSLIPSGEYTVKIKHFDNCGNGPTEWKLRVVVNGKIVLERTGSSNKDNGALIETFKFTFP